MGAYVNSILIYTSFINAIFSVVKEEIVDDDAHLPCFNGRVISWVSDKKIIYISKIQKPNLFFVL